MKLFLNTTQYIETNNGLDISLPLSNDLNNPSAWYVKPPIFEAVNENGFIGCVADGGSVNFRTIFFNPHGHGTHTECLGHITNEVYSINKNLKSYFFKAQLISVTPICTNSDLIITKECFSEIENDVEALIIRTLPNNDSKKHKNYSSTNPPYLDISVIELMENRNIQHLLIDLPSVDREDDGGKLVFHHAFWKVPENPQFHKTISELIFVNSNIKDGIYILNLQTAPFENDATPSRPVLFEIFTNK